MEGGVHDHDVRNVGKPSQRHAYAQHRRRIVEWRERAARLDVADHFGGDQSRFGEPLPAMHHPVPDGGQRAEPAAMR